MVLGTNIVRKEMGLPAARAMAVILSRPLITVAGLARPEMLVEVQGIAVLG